MHTPVAHTTQDRPPSQIILDNLTIPAQEGGPPVFSDAPNTPHSPAPQMPPLPVLQLATIAFSSVPPPLEPAVSPTAVVPQPPFPATLEHSLTPPTSPKPVTADPNY